MFLSLMTADAAASHGHEFSPTARRCSPGPGNPGGSTSPIARNPFSVLSTSSTAARQQPQQQQHQHQHRRDSQEEEEEEGEKEQQQQQQQQQQHRALLPPRQSRQPQPVRLQSRPPSIDRPPFPRTGRSGKTIMFAEPAVQVTEIPQPPPLPTGAAATTTTKPPPPPPPPPEPRPPRPKTVYNLAHPPPSNASRHPKRRLRPRVLLQLQKVSESSRPRPAVEVLPCAIFAPKLCKKISRICKKSKDRLGPDDLVVLKAPEYGSPEDEDGSDDEGLDSRDVVGVICCSSKKEDGKPAGKTEIFMEDGSMWEASSMPNGGYEFVSTDEHGLKLTARWIPKSTANKRGRSSAAPNRNSPVPTAGSDPKFSFSTISPNARRHPIIASMSRTNISVCDNYALPSKSLPSTPDPNSAPAEFTPTPTSPITSGLPLDGAVITTEPHLQRLILTTGLWVYFHEGWSPAFRYSRAVLPPLGSHSAHSRMGGWSRATSMPIGAGRTPSISTSSRSTTPDGGDRESRRGSGTFPRRMFRSGTSILTRGSSTSNTAGMWSPSLSPSSPVSRPGLTATHTNNRWSTSGASAVAHVVQSEGRQRRSNSLGYPGPSASAVMTHATANAARATSDPKPVPPQVDERDYTKELGQAEEHEVEADAHDETDTETEMEVVATPPAHEQRLAVNMIPERRVPPRPQHAQSAYFPSQNETAVKDVRQVKDDMAVGLGGTGSVVGDDAGEAGIQTVGRKRFGKIRRMLGVFRRD
ncbi:hypothetical protein BDY21DRAFT_361499 [Lineolata rhizophorae]|uniref:Uncharacterized protein n=1 Tax=Lineolata rhizophorae TaxID=578093 RepID=A0A6A6P9A5_9PEZI|nr:hypothetical protein BDY21DRAFT_361499 [Lineolata rhizophorae]